MTQYRYNRKNNDNNNNNIYLLYIIKNLRDWKWWSSEFYMNTWLNSLRHVCNTKEDASNSRSALDPSVVLYFIYTSQLLERIDNLSLCAHYTSTENYYMDETLHIRHVTSLIVLPFYLSHSYRYCYNRLSKVHQHFLECQGQYFWFTR